MELLRLSHVEQFCQKGELNKIGLWIASGSHTLRNRRDVYQKMVEQMKLQYGAMWISGKDYAGHGYQKMAHKSLMDAMLDKIEAGEGTIAFYNWAVKLAEVKNGHRPEVPADVMIYDDAWSRRQLNWEVVAMGIEPRSPEAIAYENQRKQQIQDRYKMHLAGLGDPVGTQKSEA